MYQPVLSLAEPCGGSTAVLVSGLGNYSVSTFGCLLSLWIVLGDIITSNLRKTKTIDLLMTSVLSQVKDKTLLMECTHWLEAGRAIHMTAIWWSKLETKEALRLMDFQGVFHHSWNHLTYLKLSSAGDLLDLASLVLKMMGPENTYHYWPEIFFFF